MDFDSYSNHLSDLTEYCNELLNKPNPVQQRCQVINESMQMKSVSKVQSGQLNDKRFYFSNRIVSLPHGHLFLENLENKKINTETFIKLFKLKMINS